MTIKSNSLDPLNPIRDFVLENAGERKVDFDKELYELLGEQSSLIASACFSEVIKVLRMPNDATDEERYEKLVEILCASNDSKLNIGQRTLKVLDELGLTDEQLIMAKQLIQGKINLEIRNKITPLLNESDGIAIGRPSDKKA